MRNAFLWPLLFLLASCTVGPNFKRPAPPAITNWNDLQKQQNAAVTEASNPDPLWWNSFNDPVLTALMHKAIQGNPTLQQSVLRVVESRQSVVTAAAAGLPSLNATGSYMREQLGVKGILESQGAYKQLDALADSSSPVNQLVPGLGNKISTAGTSALNGIAAPVNLYQYGLSSSWELDLFGQVRRSVEQAKASEQAQAEAANDALVMLESQIAQAYFGLRGAQMAAQEQQRQIHIAQISLNLTTNRYEGGLASDLDVQQARTQLLSEESQSDTYEKQIGQAIDQLNMLTGQQPGALDSMLSVPVAVPMVPGVVGIGVPSSLARRRPDIREAEAQLHAATAEVGVAVASFYPDITLTGSAGFRALDASYLTNWASLFYSAGPSISLPIFQGGKLTANLRTARAAQAIAALNYRATVLNALREVEDALVAYRTDEAARDQTAATVQSAELSLYLANNLRAHGLSSYLQVLTSEQSLLSARQQLVQADELLANDVATLYTALGGGWQDSMREVPKPPTPAAPPPLPAALDSAVD